MFEHDYKRYPELTNTELQVVLFSTPISQFTEDFSATVVKVHDGDTVTLRADFRDFDFPLRFLDIDAPELNQGGEEARDWLKGRILGHEVTVMIDKYNRVGKYGRLLGKIKIDGTIVSEEEIHLGLSQPFERRKEGRIPDFNQVFNINQWVKV